MQFLFFRPFFPSPYLPFPSFLTSPFLSFSSYSSFVFFIFFFLCLSFSDVATYHVWDKLQKYKILQKNMQLFPLARKP